MAVKGKIQTLLLLAWIILLTGNSNSQPDKLVQGVQLLFGDELVSAFAKFKFGFFIPESDHLRIYVGVWYVGDDNVEQVYGRIVWVANRNNPISDDSAYLKIDSTDGNLKIFADGGYPIAISSVEGARNTSVALLQSGNLVLQETNSDGSVKQVLWQSFDYPTDILLPGMKLGINLKTGHEWFLQSWLSHDSPAQGSYTFGMDPNVSNQLTVWWKGEVRWSTLVWLNGHFNFSRPGLRSHNSYTFSYTSNEQEKFFSYSVSEDVASFPILEIGPDGTLRDDRGFLIRCPLSGSCGHEKLPNCRRGVTDFHVENGFMSADGIQFKESDNLTLYECRLKCLNNCSCHAYAVSDMENNSGCEIWGRGTRFMQSEMGNYRRIYMTLEVESQLALDFHIAAKKRWWIWLIIALVVILALAILFCLLRRKFKGEEENWWLSLIIAVGVALLIPLLCYLCYLIRRKLKEKVQSIMNRRKLLRELGDDVSSSTANNRGETQENNQRMTHNELKIYNFQTIAAASNNFSATNKLGEGGFGPVYKGKLLDGREIAIKRLSRRSGQGIVEFKNEAKLVARLQHTNLVRLLGCSLQGEERILIYEYMPNKSLDFFIFDSSRKKLLNWKKRLSIIEGIAQGLVYLHKYSRLRVIHRDLKASNILLDDQLNPKISDFGMAKIFGVNESQANTKRVVGTYGYMSPEYIMSGTMSLKTDVYSFGVLVLEILSNKKNNNCYHIDRPLNLAGYAWQLWNEGKGLELIDTSIDESSPPNGVLRFLHVGLLCVQNQAIDRPTISDVISMLTNETMLLPAPRQPAFFINGNSEEQEASKVKIENCSINDVTISMMEGR